MMPQRDAPVLQVVDTAHSRKDLGLVKGRGRASAVLWPGNGARYRTMHLLELLEGDTTIDLTHPHDCAYYVIAGDGVVRDVATGEAQALREGSMIHIDANDTYRLEVDGQALTVVGGTVPPDLALYEAATKEVS